MFPFEINSEYCGNCVELMQKMPIECIDLIITSPPYDDLRDYEGYEFNFINIAEQLFRILKIGGVLIWVVNDGSDSDGSEKTTSAEQKIYFRKLGFRIHDTMIYMKSGPSYPSQDKYYQVFEYMFVLSKDHPKTINLLKDRKNRWYGEKWSKIRTRRQKDGELIKQTWQSNEGDRFGIRFNIWQYSVGFGNHGDQLAHEHPASFPELLVADHILSWSNPGDLIFDPMCGSGTVLKMAKILNRNYLGFDISQKYIEITKKRLSNIGFVMQLDI